MKCKRLNAHLHRGHGRVTELLMLAHVMTCSQCRREYAGRRRLSRDIAGLEDDSPPQALRERLMQDAMASAAQARTDWHPQSAGARAMEVLKMRRVVFIGVLAAVVVGVGLLLTSQRDSEQALAKMARAIADVKTIHMVGTQADESGELHKTELWIKVPTLLRAELEGVSVIVDDENRAVSSG